MSLGTKMLNGNLGSKQRKQHLRHVCKRGKTKMQNVKGKNKGIIDFTQMILDCKNKT